MIPMILAASIAVLAPASVPLQEATQVTVGTRPDRMNLLTNGVECGLANDPALGEQ